MFDIGFVEMLVIAIVGMVVIGPERLPGVARTVGRSLGQLRRFLKNLQRQLEDEVELGELKKSIQGDGDKEPSDEVEPPMPAFADKEYPKAAPPEQDDVKDTADGSPEAPEVHKS